MGSLQKKIEWKIGFNMMYLIDSSAWIDYLEGGISGEKVWEFLKGDNEIFTTSLNVAEVVSKVARAGGNFETAYEAVTSNAKIIEMSAEVAKETGLLNAKMRKTVKNFGLVDAFILISARKIGAKVVTSDEHFRSFKGTVFVK